MQTKSDLVNKAKQDYIEKIPKYEGLNTLVCGIIESLLVNENIAFLSVAGRTKTLDSFIEKVDRKQYVNPMNEVTDFCGIRVITYIEDEVKKACEMIEKTFHVHDDKSLDKAEELKVNEFGYRSVHYICDLGNARIKLPEYKPFKGMVFEIQIRTVLQHAWAEIEHDRSYKFSGVLPKELKRRLFTVAGLLEVADREFNSIAKEIDQYAIEIDEKTKAGDLNVELNTVSLRKYIESLRKKFRQYKISIYYDTEDIGRTVKDLTTSGIVSLQDLSELLDQGFWDYLKLIEFSPERTFSISAICRIALMIADVNFYFESIWRTEDFGIEKMLYDFLEEKFGQEALEEILEQYDCSVF